MQTPSVNPPGDYQGLHSLITSEYKTLGWDVETYWAPDSLVSELELSGPRPNILAYITRGDGPKVVLNAHLDTVPVDQEAWSVDPFGAEIHDGRLYGRGAKDCKGRIASYTLAARIISDLGVLPDNLALVLALTADEETGGQAGAGYLCQRTDFEADYAIVEGDIDEIWNAGAGILHFQVTITGESAHTMNPEKGKNAITGADRILSSINEYDDELRSRPSSVDGIDSPRCFPTLIDGGIGKSIIPPSCSMTLVREVPPDEDIEAAEAEVRERVLQAVRMTGVEIDINRTYKANPYYTDPKTDLVQLLQAKTEQVRGSAPTIRGINSTTDARYFAAMGATSVNFGPGDADSNPHSADESVDVEQVHQAGAILAMSIFDLMNGTE